MAAPPGYHGWGMPPPHMAHGPPPYPPSRPPPYHPHRPPPGGHYPPPPGYPYHGYPPPSRGYGAPEGPPPGEHREHRSHRDRDRDREPREQVPAMSPVSYADEKPGAYKAFMEKAVRVSQGGAEVALSGGMCTDRHVPDFLLCLQCWLSRTYGDPRSTGRPWRLKRLDLAKNSLSDASLCQVLDCLKRLDVRVERIFLSGNSLKAAGLNATTEYLWNCQDAVWELDLHNNEVGADSVNSLLRCIYNHTSYPVMLEPRKVLPFNLRLSGNFISNPKGLLDDIVAKGFKDGKSMIRICDKPDSYFQPHEEFLSIYVPDFLQQRATDGQPAASDPAPLRLRSRSRRRRKRKEADAAGQVPAAPAPVPVVPVATPEVVPAAEGDRHRRRKKKAEDVAAQPPPEAAKEAQPALLTEEEQKRLQTSVGEKLKKISNLPSDEGTGEMLSEFMVCMLVARKGPPEVETELASFIGQEHAAPVAKWFAKHVRHHYKAAAKGAGWA